VNRFESFVYGITINNLTGIKMFRTDYLNILKMVWSVSVPLMERDCTLNGA